jgi:hypothetical protein
MNPLRRWLKKKSRHPPRSPTPASQAVSVPPATDASFSEASVVEGKYSSEAVELLEE